MLSLPVAAQDFEKGYEAVLLGDWLNLYLNSPIEGKNDG